jgi:hypothetical protein
MVVLNAGPLLREPGYTLPGPAAAANTSFTARAWSGERLGPRACTQLPLSHPPRSLRSV